MNKEKEIYESPSAEIVLLALGDIMTLSGGDSNEDYMTDILSNDLFN